MDFRDMGVPDACYFGCPDTNFRALEARLTDAEAAVTTAKEAGVFATRMEALRGYGEVLKGAGQELSEFPDGANGPWRVEFPEGTDPEVRSKVHPLRCCHYAGVLVVGAEVPAIAIKRPDS
jgi:hypothetical protein